MSGHCVQHWPQPVHFSARNFGTSWRMSVMSRNVPVAAGIALIAVNGSASGSCPQRWSEQICSKNLPGSAMPGATRLSVTSRGRAAPRGASSALSTSFSTSSGRTSSNPRRTTRTLSSTTRAPSLPNFFVSWSRMPSNSFVSSRPALEASGDARKKAPMNAAPCMR